MKILMLILLFGCSEIRGSDRGSPLYVNKELKPYFDRFDKFAGIFGKKPYYRLLSISFSKGEPHNQGVVGYCSKIFRTFRSIVIYKPMWDNLSPVQKEVTVMHELGHCALDKPHKPDTIMNETILNSNIYVILFDKLIKDLFDSPNYPQTFHYWD